MLSLAIATELVLHPGHEELQPQPMEAENTNAALVHILNAEN